jgi:hypothetical protein
MFLSDGSKLGSAETMQKLWNGGSLSTNTNKVPTIREITVNKASSIAVNEPIYAKVSATDNEQDCLT